MLTLNVNEIFYALQGEGARMGAPSIFIRLQGCDLTCKFCDTEFKSGRLMGTDDILGYISQYPGKDIVFTGGEPGLQLSVEHVARFRDAGFYVCVETNGNHKIPKNADWITLSPKVAEHLLPKNFPDGVTEIKYVWHKGKMGVPVPSVQAEYYFLSPMFNGNNPDPENINHCIDLCLKNPRWRLTMQNHKFWRTL
jgi:7-carboxy-7-deazaguanine synthase